MVFFLRNKSRRAADFRMKNGDRVLWRLGRSKVKRLSILCLISGKFFAESISVYLVFKIYP